MVVGLNRQQEGVGVIQRELTPFQYVEAGFVSGVATRAIIQPLDVVKIRFQLQEEPLRGKERGKYSGLLQSVRLIYREEGVTAFWRGHVPAQGLSIIYGLVQFSTFEALTKQCADFGLCEFSKSVDFVCGAGAGCLATTVAMPLDVIRTQMVAQGPHRKYRDLGHAFIKIWRYEGPAGYFRGLVPSLVQIAPFTGLQFTFYNLINRYWSALVSGNNESVGRLASGAMAGMAAKTIMYPFDLVRHRLQVNAYVRQAAFGQTTSDGGMVRTFVGVVQRESYLGLFKGLSPAVVKAAAQSALSFFFYELACDLLRVVPFEENTTAASSSSDR